jgi:hypothetical protein
MIFVETPISIMSGPSDRLTKIKDTLTMNKTATAIPWDPDCTIFPTRKNLPTAPGAPPEAAWVWGEEDYIGRLNLLTPTRIKAAAAEIRTGEVVPLEWVPSSWIPRQSNKLTFLHQSTTQRSRTACL